MIKKKIIILCLFFLITTGCSVDYELEIGKDNIKELIQFTENIENGNDTNISTGQLSYKDSIDNLYKIPQPVYKDANVNPYDETQVIEGVEYYNKNMILAENQYGIEANYNHLISRYAKTKIINECYKNVSVLENAGTITLSTSRNNICFEQYSNLDIINVTITVDDELYEVTTHNADQKEENKYHWNIDRTNYSDKSIVIELERKLAEKKSQNAMAVLIGFIVVISISLLIVLFVAKNKNKSKNKI